MLQEIYINNFVLIDELRLHFDERMNVLSGETGAGKSIIIDALGLLMGERIRNDYIRDEKRKAVAEAVFDVSKIEEARIFLEEKGLVEDDSSMVIVSREIYPTGRNVARINGRTVTVTMLKTLGTHLIDMHLQNNRQNILRPVMYLQYIDSFTENSEELLLRLNGIYQLLIKKKTALAELKTNQQERAQKLDFLSYQIKEIENSNLYDGEEEELIKLQQRIKDSKRLLEGSEEILQLLYTGEKESSAYDLIYNALDIMQRLKKDSFFNELIEPLESIYYSIQDIAGQLSSFKENLDFEPGLLEETEDRLYMIKGLKNKYGSNIQEILAYLDKARAERELLASSEENQLELQNDIKKLKQEYTDLALKISAARKKAKLNLENKIKEELLDLNMPDIRFAIEINQKTDLAPLGIDEVDFLFSPNPGEEMRPVALIASGGEISRFILAMKNVLANVYRVPTLVFDEIDVGLGGSALNAMAQKLIEISRSHQIILITHAPQIASCADRHYLIQKHVKNTKTYTVVKELDEEEKTREIARMMAGDDYSDLTLEHAREIRSRAIIR